MKTLSIIGCGKVGTTLARLWSAQTVFSIGDILNTSKASGRIAAKRIGSGRAVANMSDLQAADVFMISAPDDQISQLSRRLSALSILREGDIVFHCSGALSSIELTSARTLGAQVASVHPVKSFTDGGKLEKSLTGSYCAIEGDDLAIDVLNSAFEAIGAKLFGVDAESKLMYHAASVFACNYLTALLEVSARAYEQVGLTRETAMQLMQPLVRETVDNVFEKGTDKALTGPIARGDVELVAKQLAAVEKWSADYGELYKSMGSAALSVAKQQGQVSVANLKELTDLLNKN